MIILNSVLPVFAIIALGRMLRRYGFTNDAFLRTTDSLIYFIFFPVMLFWKIGSPAPGPIVDWASCAAVLAALACAWALGLLYAKAVNMPRFHIGSFSQACFRFNTYVGMAIVFSSLGEEGIRQFGVVISFAIPFINLLAVPTLIWHSDRDLSGRERRSVMAKAIVSNPLIIACVLGILYARLETPFPTFLENTFSLLSMVALPMALISIGGSLTFSKMRGHFKVTFAASIIKLAVLPLIGYGLLKLVGADEVSLQAVMIFFALPTSTSAYVLSSQLGSDVDVASSSIVMTTVLSFFSLSIVLSLLI